MKTLAPMWLFQFSSMFLIITCIIISLIKLKISSQLTTAFAKVPCLYFAVLLQVVTRAKCTMLSKNTKQDYLFYHFVWFKVPTLLYEKKAVALLITRLRFSSLLNEWSISKLIIISTTKRLYQRCKKMLKT